VSARTVAESLDFTPPISLREMLSETAVVYAGAGQTITMTDETGSVESFVNIQGKDKVLCEYFGLQPGKLGFGGSPVS
jgi:hypothetical protein